eukprot:15089998-Alexandrium_andersonii.AAC.1
MIQPCPWATQRQLLRRAQPNSAGPNRQASLCSASRHASTMPPNGANKRGCVAHNDACEGACE